MATLTAGISASQTLIPVSAEVEIGHYTIDDEAIFVHGMSRGADGRDFTRRTASVDRAVAGTTAATHLSAATLTRYYPDAAGAGGGGVTVDNTVDPPAEVATLIIPDADLSTPGTAELSDTAFNGGTITTQLFVEMPNNNDPGLQVDGAAGATDGYILVRIRDDNDVDLFTVGGDGSALHRLQTAGSNFVIRDSTNARRFLVADGIGVSLRFIAAPADVDMAASELFLWLDDTNGAGKLMVKAKTADGTVVTGNVPLT